MIEHLDELVDIENDPEILRFRFAHDEMLMWPYVRYPLLLAAYAQEFQFEFSASAAKASSCFQYLRYLADSFVQRPLPRNKDIVIFSSGVVNVPTGRGTYINRLYDLPAGEYPDHTLIIEDSWNMKYLRPREFKEVWKHDSIRMRAHLRSLMVPAKAHDLREIAEFLRFLGDRLNCRLPEGVWSDLNMRLRRLSIMLPFLHGCYRALFDKLRPRLVILEDASYGGRAYITKWAKDMKIKVAEYQHGLTSKNHLAYNFGAKIRGSEYERYLPQYFLTYGGYWGSVINLPSEKIPIGNAYLVEQSRERIPRTSGEKRVVAVISCGTKPQALVEFVLELQRCVDPALFEIVLRPHPAEILASEARYADLTAAGIRLDRGNLYDTLRRAEIVVCLEGSTVLFEAVAFGAKVFIPEFDPDSHLGQHVDPRFFMQYSDVRDLVDKIVRGVTKEWDSQFVWERNWRKNFRHFVENTVGLGGSACPGRNF